MHNSMLCRNLNECLMFREFIVPCKVFQEQQPLFWSLVRILYVLPPSIVPLYQMCFHPKQYPFIRCAATINSLPLLYVLPSSIVSLYQMCFHPQYSPCIRCASTVNSLPLLYVLPPSITSLYQVCFYPQQSPFIQQQSEHLPTGLSQHRLLSTYFTACKLVLVIYIDVKQKGVILHHYNKTLIIKGNNE